MWHLLFRVIQTVELTLHATIMRCGLLRSHFDCAFRPAMTFAIRPYDSLAREKIPRVVHGISTFIFIFAPRVFPVECNGNVLLLGVKRFHVRARFHRV